MARKLQVLKVFHLLNTLPLGELQSRTTIERLVKPGRAPKEGPDLRTIVRKVKIVKGTSIPASTLKKIQQQKIQPRATTIKKLVSMYHRLQFQRLRAAGANQKDARKLKSYPPDKINSIISNYKKNAKKIQQNYEKTYYERVKEFKKQEREKERPVKPSKPSKPSKLEKPEAPIFEAPEIERPISDEVPFEEEIITSVYSGTDTYLDIEDEEPEEAPEEGPAPLTEPPPDDYPTLDEVIFGMSESENSPSKGKYGHDYNDWDDVADTSGLKK